MRSIRRLLTLFLGLLLLAPIAASGGRARAGSDRQNDDVRSHNHGKEWSLRRLLAESLQ